MASKKVSELARNFECAQAAVEGILLTFALERAGFEIIGGKKTKEKNCFWFKIKRIKKEKRLKQNED